MIKKIKVSNKSGIYRFIFTETGIFYIGSAVNLRQRKSDHLKLLRKGKHDNSHLQNAYNKYGEVNLIFSAVEICEIQNLIIREQYYLDTLLFAQEWIKTGHKDRRFRELGFNICPVAGSSLGTCRTPEQKGKMSEYQREFNHWIGREFTKEHKENLSIALSGDGNGMFGKTFTDEWKANRSKEYKGHGNPNFGKSWTDNQKSDLSFKLKEGFKNGRKATWTGKHLSKETKDKLSKANTGKNLGVPRSEAVKKKISDSHKGEKSHLFGKPSVQRIAVKALNLSNGVTVEYPSYKSASKELKTSQATISRKINTNLPVNNHLITNLKHTNY